MPNDQELLKLIIQADEECFQEGHAPKTRSLTVARLVMQKLQIDNYVAMGANPHPTYLRIQDIFETLYRPEDLSVGGVHLGTFMFRDVFAEISVPVIFGTVLANVFDQTNLNAQQKDWIKREPYWLSAFLDTVADIFDFGLGADDIGRSVALTEHGQGWIRSARFHLQAATSVLVHAFDFSGAIQSSILATELCFKGALASCGWSKSDIVAKIGHKLDVSLMELRRCGLACDFDLMQKAVSSLPPFVENRYALEQPSRVETGNIVMTAQFLAAEVIRQLSSRNLRRDCGVSWKRVYPNKNGLLIQNDLHSWRGGIGTIRITGMRV
jgi:hypothetical protein